MKSIRKLSYNLSVILFVLILTPNISAVNHSILQNTPLVSDSITKIIFQGGIYSGFGHQVCNGDFNGDGIDDIIITAVSENAPLIISLFYGSSTIDTIVDLTILADTVYDYQYGYSIANAGDVNNDGFDDLLVSFYQSNDYVGKVYLFLGGNLMNADCDLVLNGDRQYGGYGISVGSAGDVNGDGFSDFLVGSSIDWYFQTDTSKVHLYLGSSNLDTIPDLTFYSSNTDDYFGSTLATAGDINGDGYDDISIGSKWNSDKVFIYLGSLSIDDEVDYILQNFAPYSCFGSSICGENDFNQDGYDDVVISAHKFDNPSGGYQYGRVYIYLGGLQFTTEPELILTGDEQFGQFGYSISGAGFFNEDTFPDLIINSPFSNIMFGRAFIFYGSSTLDSSPDIIINAEYQSQFTFGGTITHSDFNNDGLDELLFSTRVLELPGKQNILYPDQVYLYSFVRPAYKIKYEATNFIYEEPNSFTFDVYIKNNGQYPWQYRNGSLTFTFNRFILRNGNLSWSIVPGYSEFPEDQQPQSTIIYDPYTIGTVETIPVDGITLSPGTQLRYARFRIQTSDSNFAIQPHNLRFVKTGLNKTNSSRWVWYNESGRLFNSENISFIDLQHEVLPVELISFIAFVNQTRVQIKWQTATELNNQGFEIQRKIENSDWISIGFNAGQGTTHEITSYYFEDDISEIINERCYYRLKQIDFNGTFTYSDEVEVIIQPSKFSLSQNYPNPFNPTTDIKYEIPKTTNVKIEVFDMLGRTVKILTNEEKPAGRYEVEFNATSVSSGVYYYRIQAGDFNQTKKMQLIK